MERNMPPTHTLQTSRVSLSHPREYSVSLRLCDAIRVRLCVTRCAHAASVVFWSYSRNVSVLLLLCAAAACVCAR